jgi:hypothetical protein
MKKHTIQVRKNGIALFNIKRKLQTEAFGNFNPVFCRYKNEIYLVNSEKGDLSAPFRRNESYLSCLYIEVK